MLAAEFLYKKKLQMAILRIPGNFRGNFGVVKFPEIPQREFPNGNGGLESEQPDQYLVTPIHRL